ncbi:acetyl-CoA carboxylase carboxyltransferase subunit alpha [uncultured Subdoligranulum sp.]|uniref:acetyl-CoA carboxylase carboxyltransferase subunit alpha n=1 Tax=uncultured Subdoligranulum sp. TaxID=512298 RepID=UPI00320A5ABC
MIKDILKEVESLDRRIGALEHPTVEDEAESQLLGEEKGASTEAESLDELKARRDALLEQCRELTPADRVFLARHQGRPRIDEYIQALFTDFFEQRGDRECSDDPSILGGIARYKGVPVTVIGHRKGSTLEENMHFRFGMPEPDGYRKALRLMEQAEKFGRPIITFIDTPGAYPGKEAEERGQGEAIARNLAEMSGLTVPIISVVTGEGSSGGALGLGVANRILMLENAVYSVLSPEGFASILWKDSSRSGEACEIMKLTAQDLLEDGIVEEVIPEPLGGAQRDHEALFAAVDAALERHLTQLCKMSGKALADQRYKKYRQIGL